MVDWKREIDESPDIKADTEADVPRHWQASADTITAIRGRNEGAKEREWVDKGIQDVPVSQVDLSESHVRGGSDFKKVSQAEMVEGFHKLETTVRPSVEKG